MKKTLYRLLIILFSLTFLVSAFFLGRYFWDSYTQKSSYAQLADLMADAGTTPRPLPTESIPTETEAVTEPTDPYVQVPHPETGQLVSVLPEFSVLYPKNPDIVGWMKIPGTRVNYPVMQTPDRPDYYLTRNFQKENNAHGCLYVREVCDVFTPSDNITIYGHRMRDGSMFADLSLFQEEAFYREHTYIYFDTLTQLHTYQILSVFLTTASQGKGFSYHTFVDAESEEDFDSFVATCKELALYDTGITATYGDKLITLSTCEYSQTNGRLVIVAKRVV